MFPLTEPPQAVPEYLKQEFAAGRGQKLWSDEDLRRLDEHENEIRALKRDRLRVKMPAPSEDDLLLPTASTPRPALPTFHASSASSEQPAKKKYRPSVHEMATVAGSEPDDGDDHWPNCNTRKDTVQQRQVLNRTTTGVLAAVSPCGTFLSSRLFFGN